MGREVSPSAWAVGSGESKNNDESKDDLRAWTRFWRMAERAGGA